MNFLDEENAGPSEPVFRSGDRCRWCGGPLVKDVVIYARRGEVERVGDVVYCVDCRRLFGDESRRVL